MRRPADNPFIRRATCVGCGSDINQWRDVRSTTCYEPCAWQRARRAAHYRVHKAILTGLLAPARQLSCVDCGDAARDYDHRDYSKPLEVVPVCRSCNQRRGPAASLSLAA
jgi:hypothetical protein